MSRLKQFCILINYNSWPLGKKNQSTIFLKTLKKNPKTRSLWVNTDVGMKCLTTGIEKKKCVVLVPAMQAVFILGAD